MDRYRVQRSFLFEYCIIFHLEAGKLRWVQVLGLWKTKLSTLRRKNSKKQKTETVIHNKLTLHKPVSSAQTDKMYNFAFASAILKYSDGIYS